MPSVTPKLIVALDVGSLAEARDLIAALGDIVDIYKVGSQLFTACGPAVVRFIEARGKQVFLDLKFHDIPNTVANAVRAAVDLTVAVDRGPRSPNSPASATGGLLLLTVHTCGGEAMLRAAVEAAHKSAEENRLPRPRVVGVTVLTSEAKEDNIRTLILERARLAQRCGLDGAVASVQEAAMLREEFGPGFIIVTPGIRPSGADHQDQKRVATPRQAAESGSHYIVVGRPIVKAERPYDAALAILKELGQE